MSLVAELPHVEIAAPSGPTRSEVESLIDLFLSGRSPRTSAAYAEDLRMFGKWAGAPVADAVRSLLAHGPGAANRVALSYRSHLVESGRAPATVNRRIASLRSLVKLAQTVGLALAPLSVPGVKSQAYRDTRGPGLAGFRSMIAAAKAQKCVRKQARDVALLYLLHHLALRRAEVLALDVADVDFAESRLWIVGKGFVERQAVTIPPGVARALRAWLDVRGDAAGPSLRA